MAVLKLKYKNKDGKIKKIRNWYVEFKDHSCIIRRMPAYPDKGASKILEFKIRELVSCINAGLPERVFELSQWFKKQPPGIKNHLVTLGLLDVRKTEGGFKFLTEYLRDFKESIKTASLNIKDYSYKQANMTIARVRKIFEGCGFTVWQDVNSDKIQLYLNKLKSEGLKPATIKFYINAFRCFAKWMVNQGYAAIDSVPELPAVKVPRRQERSFEFDEFAALLEAAAKGPERFGLSGAQRRLVYLLALETGLRRNELRKLTPASFNFKKCTVFIGGDNTKNGDDTEQNLSPQLNQQIKEYVRMMMPNVQLFNIPDKSAAMLQDDCAAAGIEVNNIRGRLKFHSLRHTTASFLIALGNNLKIVQEVMRHKSIDITVSRYGHLLKGQKKLAIAGLGKLSVSQAVTGT